MWGSCGSQLYCCATDLPFDRGSEFITTATSRPRELSGDDPHDPMNRSARPKCGRQVVKGAASFPMIALKPLERIVRQISFQPSFFRTYQCRPGTSQTILVPGGKSSAPAIRRGD